MAPFKGVCVALRLSTTFRYSSEYRYPYRFLYIKPSFSRVYSVDFYTGFPFMKNEVCTYIMLFNISRIVMDKMCGSKSVKSENF